MKILYDPIYNSKTHEMQFVGIPEAVLSAHYPNIQNINRLRHKRDAYAKQRRTPGSAKKIAEVYYFDFFALYCQRFICKVTMLAKSPNLQNAFLQGSLVTPGKT